MLCSPAAGAALSLRIEKALTGCAWVQALTEGIHTKEALDLVREHVRGIMGPAAVAFSNSMIKMSKLQAAQVDPRSLQPTQRLTGLGIALMAAQICP